MPETTFTPEYLKSLRAEYASQATESQFRLWIEECKIRGLMPQRDVVLQIRGVSEYDSETRQKVFRKRAIYITTIQALRRLAERTGKYAGQLPSKWVYLDENGQPGIESDVPLPENKDSAIPKRPWAAKASVLRTGFSNPVTVPARFEAYAQYFTKDNRQQLNSTWANRGPEQLEKCAEALALRKAFPEELGGLYLQEELGSEEVVQAAVQQETPETATEEKPKRGRPKKSESVQGGALAVPQTPEYVENTGKISSSGNGPIAGSDAPSVAAAPAPTPEASQTAAPLGANIHGVVVTDNDLPEFGPNAEPEKPATDEERKVIKARVHNMLPDEKDRTKLIHYCKARFNTGSVSVLSMKQWNEVFADLEKDKGIINQ
jgi:phage recombination protein Bet